MDNVSLGLGLTFSELPFSDWEEVLVLTKTWGHFLNYGAMKKYE